MGTQVFRLPSSVAFTISVHLRVASELLNVIREVEAETGQGIVLIVIDTISRALCGGDENSPKDMGAIVAATSKLQAETKAHVLWVHHMPQDGAERLRGHGALLGAMDTTVHVAKGGAVRTATVVKANDAEEGVEYRLYSRKHHDRRGHDCTGGDPGRHSNAHQVRRTEAEEKSADNVFDYCEEQGRPVSLPSNGINRPEQSISAPNGKPICTTSEKA